MLEFCLIPVLIALGIIAGVLPARQAMNLKIFDALRRSG